MVNWTSAGKHQILYGIHPWMHPLKVDKSYVLRDFDIKSNQKHEVYETFGSFRVAQKKCTLKIISHQCLFFIKNGAQRKKLVIIVKIYYQNDTLIFDWERHLPMFEVL